MNVFLNNTRTHRLIATLLFCILQGYAMMAYAQSNGLSMSFKHLSIEQAINKIEQKTDYKFLYNKDIVDVSKEINITEKNKSIQEILDAIFQGSKIDYTINNKQIVLSSKSDPTTVTESATPKTVSGRILDNNGLPVIGAYVIEKGTSNGTITDVNGKFEFKVSPRSSLLFSFIGFQSQEIPVGSNNSFHIKLNPDQKTLDEVVVVGYGTQRKATVTGSIAQIKGTDLQQSANRNVSNNLVGRMTGVIANNRSGEPGSDNSDIYIRGKGTLGNNNPLYVIDGVATGSGISSLNPSDIQSLTVLKDASAAIYGAEAANGVILVTTKKGHGGKPTITYDGSYGLSQITRLPKLMNAYEYMNYDDEVNARYGRNQMYTNIKGGYLDGTINTKQYGNTDWMKAIFAPVSPVTQHSLSLRGGNDWIRYYVSGSYLYQKSNYRNSPNNYNTLQMRANLDGNVTKNFKVIFQFSERQENRNNSNWSSNGITSIMGEAMREYPYLYDYYPNGLPGAGLEKGRNPVLMENGTSGFSQIVDNYYNTKVGFDYKMPWLTEGLSVSGYVANELHFINQKSLDNMYDAYNYNPNTGDYDNIRANTGNSTIDLNQRADNNTSTTINLKLDYEKHIGDNSIGAFVAYEQNQQKGGWFSAYRRDFLSANVPYMFAGGDYQKSNDGGGSISARQNYFGRVTYAYKDKYLAEMTMRYDGSQNFAPETRWGLFPGISVGWRISQEPFFQSNVKFVDELKLKASWGKLGNDRVNQFQYLSSFSLGTGSQFGVNPQQGNGFTPGVMPNPNITWEKVDMKNIGFESQMWKGLLGIDAQYFYALRSDILTPKNASVPDYTGLKLPDENIGVISNSGIELSMTHKNQLGQFRYNLGFNFTFARNKIHFFDEAADTPDWQKRTGYSIDSYLVYKTDGIYHTQAEIDNSPHLPGTKPGDIKYLDVDGSGTITSKDKVLIHESPIPEIVYGLTMGGQYKGFELNILWTAQARAKQMVIPGNSFNKNEVYYSGRWISEAATPNAVYPRAFDEKDQYNTLYSDFWLKDASFIRLKNVELAYNLSSDLLKKYSIQSIRIYLSGSNLFVLDHIKIQDPESNDQSGWTYPQQRIYNIGMNLSF